MSTSAVITPESQTMAQKPTSPTNKFSDAEKYRAAYSKVFESLPPWKKEVVLSKKYEDRVHKDFVKEVIIEAEKGD